jgi:hypothetical protein
VALDICKDSSKVRFPRVDREYHAEAERLEAAGSDDGPEGDFWLTWPQIRILIENNEAFNPGPYRISESLERSAKRALHSLVKRGEIGKMETSYLTRYLTKETDQGMTDAAEALLASLAKGRPKGKPR